MMSPLVLLIVLGLAVYRATRFWIRDSLIANQRIWVQNKVLGRKSVGPVRGKLHELLGCPHCVSGQLSWIVVVIVNRWASIPLPGLFWVAVWGITPIVYRWTDEPTDLHILGTVKHREQKYDTPGQG